MKKKCNRWYLSYGGRREEPRFDFSEACLSYISLARVN